MARSLRRSHRGVQRDSTDQVIVNIHDKVTWHRGGGLPRGQGKIVDIKRFNDRKLHMVRDKNNVVYGLREDQLEPVS
jgi:hypothetical protein